MIGRRIGSWILEEELARGGMGAVFVARHAELGTRAAVKSVARIPGLDADLQQRFDREARLHAGLQHTHIARVYDFVEQEGVWFLVMELLSGGSLADRIDGGALPDVPRSVSWIRQALAGLGYAHSKGIVHRDVKPGNLLLDDEEQIKVGDFGIARSATAAKLTCTGATLGTVEYMSPEQLEAPEKVDHRSDVYSTGAVLYELLTGHPPFPGDGPSQILRARLVTPTPTPLREIRPEIDPRLDAVVQRAMSEDMEARFQTAEEFREALAPFETESRPPASGTVLWNTPPPPVPTAPQSHPTPVATAASPARRRRSALAGAALLAVLAASGAVGLVFSLLDDSSETRNRSRREERRAELLETIESALADARAAEERAREAADATRKASEEAQTAARSVLTARDGQAAAQGAERSAKAAEAAADGAKSAGEAATEAAEAAQTATESATQVQQLARSRLDPSQLAWTLATIPGGSSSGEDPARRALEAAEEAREAAAEARRSAEEARIEAESAHRAALDSKMAAHRMQSVPDPSQMAAAQQQALEEQQRAMQEARARQMAPMGQMEPPDQPVVAVLAPGPPVFAAPLEETLGERLRRSGLDVQDPRSIPSVDRLIRTGDPDPEELGRLLVQNGFHVLVLAPVEIGEQRTMTVRGQEGSLSLGQVRLNAYLLPADRRIGRGWREAVEFTELSAQAKAAQALMGATPELVQAIRRDWSGFRSQVAALRGGSP